MNQALLAANRKIASTSEELRKPQGIPEPPTLNQTWKESVQKSIVSVVDKLYMPITDSEDIAEFNRLYESFKLSANIEGPCYADLYNLRGARYSVELCAGCRRGRINCYKTGLNIEGTRIKAVKIPCSKSVHIDFSGNATNANVGKTSISTERLGIPDKYQSCTLKDWVIGYDNADATQYVGKCIKDNASMFISGAAGCGKTMLCSIIAVERANIGKSSRFFTVTDLLNDLRDFDNNLARNEKDRLVKTCPCLIIDDLGAEYQTDWVASTLFSIIDSRYKANLQIIINSNFSLDTLKNRIKGYHGERIERRIAEMCKCFVIGKVDLNAS